MVRISRLPFHRQCNIVQIGIRREAAALKTGSKPPRILIKLATALRQTLNRQHFTAPTPGIR
jgi:hypothetical protein